MQRKPTTRLPLGGRCRVARARHVSADSMRCDRLRGVMKYSHPFGLIPLRDPTGQQAAFYRRRSSAVADQRQGLLQGMFIPGRVISRPSRSSRMSTIASEPVMTWHQTVPIVKPFTAGVGPPHLTRCSTSSLTARSRHLGSARGGSALLLPGQGRHAPGSR